MKKLLFFLLLVGGGAAAYYYFWFLPKQQQSHEPKKPLLAKLNTGDVIEKVSATGKVIPREKILVSTDVPLGIVTAINPEAEPNHPIRQGTWLVKLDDSLAKAGLKEAESALGTAKAAREGAEAKRKAAAIGIEVAKARASYANKELDDKKQQLQNQIPPGVLAVYQEKIREAILAVSHAEALVAEAVAGIGTADANVLKAQAGMDLANKRLEMMTINAPRDGIILEKKVLVGQPVSPQNSPLFIMMPGGGDWEVFAMVSEGDIAKVQEGQGVEFTADAYNSKNVKFKGRVLKKDRVPTQMVGTSPIGLGLTGPTNYGVTITVQHDEKLDKDYPLLAGMTANVDILVSTALATTRVPNAALQYRPGNLTKQQQDDIDAKGPDWTPIWIWNGTRAEMKFIKVGVNDGAFAQLLGVEGGGTLPPGTEVVTEDPPPDEEKGGIFGGKVNIPIR